MKLVKIKSMNELKKLRDAGRISFGIPGQGDFDECTYIAIKNKGASHIFRHNAFDGEYCVVNHWHPIHPEVLELFKEIFEDSIGSDK